MAKPSGIGPTLARAPISATPAPPRYRVRHFGGAEAIVDNRPVMGRLFAYGSAAYGARPAGEHRRVYTQVDAIHVCEWLNQREQMIADHIHTYGKENTRV